MSRTIFLALGTNLGDRAENLNAALDLLEKSSAIQKSSIYETPPWGYTDQPAFLNMAVKTETDLPPLELLSWLKNLEVRIGREKSFRWGPRLIDLDILFYDDIIFESENLTIPHPRLHERAFVLVPLAEIAPEFLHPVLKKTVSQLLAEIDSTGIEIFRAGK